MAAFRIFIADDHEVVRKGLCALLQAQPDWEVCGEAADGREAIRCARVVNRLICSSSRSEEALSNSELSLGLLTSVATSFVGSRRLHTDLLTDHEPNSNPSREGSRRSKALGRFPSREGSGVGGYVQGPLFLSDLLVDGAPARTWRSANVVPASGRRCCVLCRQNAGRASLRSLGKPGQRIRPPRWCRRLVGSDSLRSLCRQYVGSIMGVTERLRPFFPPAL